MDVSIIIVNYNTKQLLKDCLNSIYEHTKDIDFEIIVSDNGSKDGSVEMIKTEFRQVILIENNANLGFGKANNRALAVAKGKYIFYLNSDTILLNNAVKLFFDYFEENKEKENIGALGCNLLDKQGNINASYASYASYPNFNGKIKDLIHANYGLWKHIFFKIIHKKIENTGKHKSIYEKKIGEVGFIIGADLFIENNEFAKFDEKYFLYLEETDLEWNLYKKTGKKCYLIEGPKIIHLEGESSKETKKLPYYDLTSFSGRCKCISRVYYCKKNYSRFKSFIIKILTLLLWLNPLIIKYTYKSIFKLLKT